MERALDLLKRKAAIERISLRGQNISDPEDPMATKDDYRQESAFLERPLNFKHKF